MIQCVLNCILEQPTDGVQDTQVLQVFSDVHLLDLPAVTKEHLPILLLWDSLTLFGKLHHDELAGPL